ncbi:hypothetical protein [Streptomyces sp. NPDC008125]|uniref:hypothetical protein n=1 Tax=Streptomyces sp. NPDC008125 TaxID=3364811 RepID=UPI0036EDC89F
MTTRVDEEPEFGADDPLAVILRPGHDRLAPPPGRYEELRRGAAGRRYRRGAAVLGMACAVAGLAVLPFRLAAGPGVPAMPASPAAPAAPASTGSGSTDSGVTEAPTPGRTAAPRRVPSPVPTGPAVTEGTAAPERASEVPSAAVPTPTLPPTESGAVPSGAARSVPSTSAAVPAPTSSPTGASAARNPSVAPTENASGG